MNIIGLIPARGGSKTIHMKNIKPLNDKPLLSYTIEAAKKSKITRVIVSSDDEKIIEVAKENGAEVPFIRPKDLSKDITPDRPVIMHLLNWLSSNEKIIPDLLIFLRPTTPFKTPEIINLCIDKIKSIPKLTSLRTITKVESTNHPYWMFKNINEELIPFIPNINIMNYYQRQLLPDCYRINGVVDVLKPDIVINNENHYGNHIGYVELNDFHSIDIDTELDFELSNFLIEKGYFN